MVRKKLTKANYLFLAAHGKRSGTSRMDSSNLVFRRPNSLIFSYPKGKKSLENILSSPYKRFRSPNSFNFPLLTRMVEGKQIKFSKNFKHCNMRFFEWFSNTVIFFITEALEGQELLEAMEPEYVDDKEKRDRSFDSVFLGNRG